MRTIPVLLFLALAHVAPAQTDATKPKQPAADNRFQIPPSDDGLPGAGPIRRQEWFQKTWTQRRSAFAQRQARDQASLVFLGDSITQGWVDADPDFFARGNVGRGISAQTTPQLLVRMHADVIALKPRVVHIMAGTNDIAHNTGPMSAQDSKNNLMAMCEIARAHKIRVVLGSVPTASKYWWRPEAKPKEEAGELNAWLRGYAREIGAKYADYASAFADAQGNVKLDLAKDEVHPTAAGYALMRPIAEAVIEA
jgi:lysophospholipase L1-like esterase